MKIGRLFSKQPNRPLFTTTKANSIECLITTSQSSGVDGIFSGLGQPLIEADERRVKGRNFRLLFFRADNRLQIGITNPLCKPAIGPGEVP